MLAERVLHAGPAPVTTNEHSQLRSCALHQCCYFAAHEVSVSFWPQLPTLSCNATTGDGEFLQAQRFPW